ncbi:MAG: M23 family metallopeptidase [Planctomycetes bacterium]|nr:M23 family metallopeptidase [Planctomycetota bacterium]
MLQLRIASLVLVAVAPVAAQTKALDPTVGACTRKDEFAARQTEIDARIVALTGAATADDKARLGAAIAEEFGHCERIENLIRYREPDLRHVFLPLLAADHWPIRARALYGLKMVGDAQVALAVAAALDDPDPRVRELAASCLGRLAADTAALAARLEREDDDCVRATIEAAIATVESATKPYRPWQETLVGPAGARRVEWAWTVRGPTSFNDYDARTVETPTATGFHWPISWYDGSLFAPVPRRSFGAGGNHAGEDMAWFREGTSVFAVTDGLVRMVQGAGGNWGFLVLVEHRLEDGRYFCALYGHLGFDILVRPGDVVRAGQKLGTVGLSCSVENGGYGAHLHFGIGDNPFRKPQGLARGARLGFDYEGERVQAPITDFLYMPDRPDEYGFPGLGVRVQVPDGPSLDLHVGNVKMAQQVSWITGYVDGCRGWLDPRSFLEPRIAPRDRDR